MNKSKIFFQENAGIKTLDIRLVLDEEVSEDEILDTLIAMVKQQAEIIKGAKVKRIYAYESNIELIAAYRRKELIDKMKGFIDELEGMDL